MLKLALSNAELWPADKKPYSELASSFQEEKKEGRTWEMLRVIDENGLEINIFLPLPKYNSFSVT